MSKDILSVEYYNNGIKTFNSVLSCLRTFCQGTCYRVSFCRGTYSVTLCQCTFGPDVSVVHFGCCIACLVAWLLSDVLFLYHMFR